MQKRDARMTTGSIMKVDQKQPFSVDVGIR